jgi:hypothetical protein
VVPRQTTVCLRGVRGGLKINLKFSQQNLEQNTDIIFIKIGRAGNILEKDCAQLGIAPNAFEFRGDYYALPNVIPLLTRPSMMELVMEVLSYPLPQRKDK